MENLFNTIKSFILNDVNSLLPEYESEGVSLPLFTEKTVVFGSIDPLKNNQNSVCSVYPDTKEEKEEQIDGESTEENKITITFICRNASYEILMKRICRYASALKKALTTNYNMDNLIQNIAIGTEKYYPDCGTVEKQATAVEVELTIYTETDYQ